MPHEVIMPALGMAQETGRLVAWHRAVGEPVGTEDILMEVETDKSVMEVAAGFAGFVVDLRAEAGTDVPVGAVIAVIAESADQVVAPAKPEPAKAGLIKVEPVQLDAKRVALPTVGRILASPKARRLAAEQGLDLGRLAAAGVSQPYLAADIARLKALGSKVAAAPGVVAAPALAVMPNRISGRATAANFLAFQDRLEAEGPAGVRQSAIWAAFAAASLRAQTSVEELVIEVVQAADGDTVFYADPDGMRFSLLSPVDAVTADLTLYDLTASRVGSMQSGLPACPELSIVRVGEAYELTLCYQQGQLARSAALGLIEGLARRIEKPLLHLI